VVLTLEFRQKRVKQPKPSRNYQKPLLVLRKSGRSEKGNPFSETHIIQPGGWNFLTCFERRTVRHEIRTRKESLKNCFNKNPHVEKKKENSKSCNRKLGKRGDSREKKKKPPKNWGKKGGTIVLTRLPNPHAEKMGGASNPSPKEGGEKKNLSVVKVKTSSTTENPPKKINTHGYLTKEKKQEHFWKRCLPFTGLKLEKLGTHRKSHKTKKKKRASSATQHQQLIKGGESVEGGQKFTPGHVPGGKTRPGPEGGGFSRRCVGCKRGFAVSARGAGSCF